MGNEENVRVADRAGVIERVTPLGFFALGILVVEALLGALALRAEGEHLTLLIYGLLFGFVFLCALVAVMASSPKYRPGLVGKAEASPASAIADMHLTSNDIRAIYFASMRHGRLAERSAPEFLMGGNQSQWEHRLRKLEDLKLVRRAAYSRTGEKEATLTHEGRALANVIGLLARPIIELERNGPNTRWWHR